MPNTDLILQVDSISAGYGHKSVLQNASFTLNKGEVLSIIGQNGSGKSTLLKAIGGLVQVNSGKVIYKSDQLPALHPHLLIRKGISVFLQGGLVLPILTLEEHFELAARQCGNILDKLLIESVYEHFPSLRALRKERAGNLSGGERQMLSFGIFLVQGTKTWLLDEPTAGLAPEIVDFTVKFLERKRSEDGISMVLVEHNMDVAFGLGTHVIIVKDGTLTRKFSPEEFHQKSFLETFVYN
ncbi:MAG: ATP-binding cassette domain-containing protein [Chlorobiales bacterium]|nr:ATP-binding cassette domain-containing protein [Chlorobiales bacterium]